MFDDEKPPLSLTEDIPGTVKLRQRLTTPEPEDVLVLLYYAN
jgi:hypothetical protein